MTTTIHPQPSSPSRHPRWDAFKRSFTQSNYITDFWNWLMTLMSKAAELVLFGSVLYSGYQLLPNITHAPAQVDAVVFVIQQAALDIGGMGLLKLAKRAGLPKDSFPMRVGVILVVLMILNVVLASLKQTVPLIPPGVFIGIETVLLIARAIMAVLFGYAIHALREEYGESTITIKDAGALQQHIVDLTADLKQVQLNVQQHLTQQIQNDRTELVNRLNSLASELQEVQSQVQLNVQQGVQSQVQQVMEQLPHLVQQHVNHVLQGQLYLPSELHTKRQHTQDTVNSSQGSLRAKREQVNPRSEPLHGVHSTLQVNPGTQPAQGGVSSRSEQGKGAQVQQFVREQVAQGHTPTLDEIMQTCQCSKNTAIHHRRAILGDHLTPRLTVLRAQ